MTADRRAFLAAIGGLAAAGAMPGSIARALTLPAAGRTGTIRDVEHIVVLMQENRSFDHYFGSLRGVRGFGDPRTPPLPGGRSVFAQPGADGTGEVLPFRLDAATTSAPVMQSLDHSWRGSYADWARHDCWIRHKTAMAMGHFTRADLPYYYALADAFTIGDNYFCSVHGPTNPNRLFLFSGTSGLAVGDAGEQCVHNVDDGNWSGDRTRDKADFAGFRWTTYAERLERAGVSWKVYQEFDNYGDNSLAYFAAFRGGHADPALLARGRAIVPGSTAANAPQTQAQHLVDAFAADVAADRLPQVSWIVAPYKFTEHPEASPQHGQALVERLVEALTANPDVWAKTALIINYDENDGFFDHVPAPIPAISAGLGASTVDTRGERLGDEPVGLGIRVPLLVVSPWTRGGWVNSELFDHSSVIRFIERRFGVVEPNITPWRRAVTGDLTSMFDFAAPDRAALAALPSMARYEAEVAAAARRPAPRVPAAQRMPRQEPGQRPARALPYDLAVEEAATNSGLALTFVNAGSAGAVFALHDRAGTALPRHYTVERGRRLAATVEGYDVAIYGPNGFVREIAGSPAVAGLAVALEAPAGADAVTIVLRNLARAPRSAEVTPLAYGGPRRTVRLAPGETRRIDHRIGSSDHWYDLAVTIADTPFRRRFAGHVETGRPSRSDPALSGAT